MKKYYKFLNIETTFWDFFHVANFIEVSDDS